MENTVIERVRLKQADQDAPLARQRLSFLFSGSEIQPARLAPSAVLVVRSMRDPLPGRVAEDVATARSPSVEWQSAARSQLDDLYGKARRPAAGPVPASAEAVLFADYGELLACLALDLSACEGGSWWWRSTLRNQLSLFPGAWFDAWARNPRYIPSALQQLSERGKAASVLEKITPAQAWRLLVAVARVYALPEGALWAQDGTPQAAFRERTQQARAPRADSGSQPGLKREADEESLPQSEPLRDELRMAPWEPVVQPWLAPEQLGFERRTLLGVSLLLHRSPQRALSPGFACALDLWVTSKRAMQAEKLVPREDGRAWPIPIDAPSRASKNEPGAAAIQFDCEVEGDGKDKESDKARIAKKNREGFDSDTSVPMFVQGAGADALEQSAPMPASGTHIAPAKRNISNSTQNGNSLELKLHLENGCRTRLGGVFYLVHFLRQAILPYFDVGLGGWALLELLARCLLEGGTAGLVEDGIWDALALLDGRDPGTNAAKEFKPQTVYEAPEAWLQNIESSERFVRFRSHGVELWHPEGFLTLDSRGNIPAAISFAGVLRGDRQRRIQTRRRVSVRPMQLAVSAELRRFLHFILPYTRWRLGRAIGNARPIDVLMREGTFYVTRSHIDLVMGFTQVSLAARLAGMDANPGWVRELGRVVTFHFVQEGSRA